ncbi:hypothetical protein [Streptomyces sp. NPDC091209]|uniref:hypothetical protein n=1 Tax=Streptomyces sp. NPDC091209 TaxID=3365974 RepID=UPI0037F245A3
MAEPRTLHQLVRDAAARHRARERPAQMKRLGSGEGSTINRLTRRRAVGTRYDPQGAGLPLVSKTSELWARFTHTMMP